MPLILLVEDNMDNRDMLARRLQRGGFDVRLANNGREGIILAEECHPNLILMDLSMPVLDGWEATRRIKANPGLKSIPIIALTGHAMKNDREKALAVGADDYVSKPIDFTALIKSMQYWLEHAGST
jgi:CheY-like chemotaxis protein